MLVEIPPRKIRDGVAQIFISRKSCVTGCIEQMGLSSSKNEYRAAMNPRNIRKSMFLFSRVSRQRNLEQTPYLSRSRPKCRNLSRTCRSSQKQSQPTNGYGSKLGHCRCWSLVPFTRETHLGFFFVDPQPNGGRTWHRFFGEDPFVPSRHKSDSILLFE